MASSTALQPRPNHNETATQPFPQPPNNHAPTPATLKQRSNRLLPVLSAESVQGPIHTHTSANHAPSVGKGYIFYQPRSNHLKGSATHMSQRCRCLFVVCFRYVASQSARFLCSVGNVAVYGGGRGGSAWGAHGCSVYLEDVLAAKVPVLVTCGLGDKDLMCTSRSFAMRYLETGRYRARKSQFHLHSPPFETVAEVISHIRREIVYNTSHEGSCRRR